MKHIKFSYQSKTLFYKSLSAVKEACKEKENWKKGAKLKEEGYKKQLVEPV